jgi:uncharacterized membrane protein YgcG
MWLGQSRLSRHSALIAAVAFYGTVSLAATTLFYKELYVFSAFPYFINNLNTGLTATIAAALAAALTCMLPAPPQGVSTRTALSGALGRPRLLVTLGLLNSAQNTTQIAAINALGPRYAAATTLVGQSVIPFTLLLSCMRRRHRRRRHHPLQLLGAALVIGGVAVVVAPKLRPDGGEAQGGSGGSGGDADGEGDDVGGGGGAGGAGGAAAAWLAVYVLSCLPQALLNVLVEEAFAESSLRGKGAGGRHCSGGMQDSMQGSLQDSLQGGLQGQGQDGGGSGGGGRGSRGGGRGVGGGGCIGQSAEPEEALRVRSEDDLREPFQLRSATEAEEEEEPHSGPGCLTQAWAVADLAVFRRHPAVLAVRSLGLVAAMNALSCLANFGAEVLLALCQHGALGPLGADLTGGARLLLAPAAAPTHARAGGTGGGGGVAAWVAVLHFAPLGSLFVVSTVLLVHCGSAASMFLVAAACLPLQNYILSLPAAMGALAAPLSPWLWYGLVVIVSGLLSYGVGAETF